MKRVVFALALILGFTGVSMAQQASPTTTEQTSQSNAEITFEKEVHDFGQIPHNGDGTYEFKYTNTGTDPLLISNCRGSCGCTVPTCHKEPLAPGESTTIRVRYDTNRVGPFTKSVTVTSNAKNGTKILRIKGEVLPSAPASAE